GPAPPPLMLTSWSPFRNTPAPTIGQDETGVDNGSQPLDTAQVRAYAWGKRGADWARTGRFLVRFDDRFDPSGGLRSSAIAVSPWPDENTAGEAVGTGNYGGTRWTLSAGDDRGQLIDPSGRAAIASGCRPNASHCVLYALV